MARKIAETPILQGSDAIRFERARIAAKLIDAEVAKRIRRNYLLLKSIERK